ncbi:Acetyltransferase (GNAT) domain-containing protein [Amphibacillus marinus]|uniref:Acetyltransferase (GNAT) domain-containing protein n=1 Tax=Amphibacillus marinus TaxID=872970 RepID=A0A1H8QB44_9BACI|nr:GNAT family N-acetyltransferase [Amphibacillus marinus]SEO51450.1 Acetyltransferase (GNAT) domain-containing protein [Amphibacillus marinus]
MKVIEAASEGQVKDAFAVREQVFIQEQGIDPNIEMDQADQAAIHIVGYVADTPVAVARMRIVGQTGKVQRVAVLAPYRNKGYGKTLMLELEQIAAKHHLIKTVLNAQAHAIDFYKSLNYNVTSDLFLEAGIEHVSMEKLLS